MKFKKKINFNPKLYFLILFLIHGLREEREHRYILTVEKKSSLTLISTTRITILNVNEFYLVIRVILMSHSNFLKEQV